MRTAVNLIHLAEVVEAAAEAEAVAAVRILPLVAAAAGVVVVEAVEEAGVVEPLLMFCSPP